MNELKISKKGMGVLPPSDRPLDPRQQRFIESYFNVDSQTFGNSLQSAIAAGYSMETSKNLTHNRPRWLSEKLGQLLIMEPEHLLLKLSQIINSPQETTQNKLKAIDMMMKHRQMFGKRPSMNVLVNIQNVLD